MTFRLQALNHLALLLEEHLGLDALDAEHACHRFRRGPAIPGEHDDLYTVLAEQRQGFRRRGLDRISHAEQTGRLAYVDSGEHDRLSITAQRLCPLHQVSQLDARFSKARLRATWWPSIWPMTPFPVLDAKSRASVSESPALARRPQWPRPAGAHSPSQGWLRDVAGSLSLTEDNAVTDIKRGFPSVRVPVLSTTRVSTFQHFQGLGMLH